MHFEDIIKWFNSHAFIKPFKQKNIFLLNIKSILFKRKKYMLYKEKNILNASEIFTENTENISFIN